MEQTEILEGNRLIADFMGLKVELIYEDNTVVKGNKMLTASANKIEPFVYIQPTFMHVAPLDSKTAIEEMVTQKIWRNIQRLSKYHSSWDWLMPVIEKISKVPVIGATEFYDTCYPRTFGMLQDATGLPMFRFNCCALYVGGTLIEAAWIAIVEFIKAEIQTSSPIADEKFGKGQNIA